MPRRIVDLRGLRLAPLVLSAALASSVGAQSDFSLIDQRAIDGSVLVVPRVVTQRPGPDPFVASSAWQLTLASSYFRVLSDRIAARAFNVDEHLPATTIRQGEVVANGLTSALGRSARSRFAPGEIVRVLDLNTAFKSVRMDLEAVCRRDPTSRRRRRGRVVFKLGGQVGRKTLAEANAAVAAELEPIGLQEVVRHCDPETGEPPMALRPGLDARDVVAILGLPPGHSVEGELELLDYGNLQVFVREGVVARIGIPALD